MPSANDDTHRLYDKTFSWLSGNIRAVRYLQAETSSHNRLGQVKTRRRLVLSILGRVGKGRILAAIREPSRIAGCGGAVVAVGDVQRVDRVERLLQGENVLEDTKHTYQI